MKLVDKIINTSAVFLLIILSSTLMFLPKYYKCNKKTIIENKQNIEDNGITIDVDDIELTKAIDIINKYRDIIESSSVVKYASIPIEKVDVAVNIIKNAYQNNPSDNDLKDSLIAGYLLRSAYYTQKNDFKSVRNNVFLASALILKHNSNNIKFEHYRSILNIQQIQKELKQKIEESNELKELNEEVQKKLNALIKNKNHNK
jgi:hypothetical protein